MAKWRFEVDFANVCNGLRTDPQAKPSDNTSMALGQKEERQTMRFRIVSGVVLTALFVLREFVGAGGRGRREIGFQVHREPA